MILTIREAHPFDLSGFERLFNLIEKLHRENLPSRFRQPLPEYASTLLSETLADAKSKLLFADLQGRLVGFVLLMEKSLVSHPTLIPAKFISVEMLAVDPEVRRKGIGKELMSHAEAFARAKGFPELELNVWHFNQAAEDFYARLGYKTVRTFLTKVFATS